MELYLICLKSYLWYRSQPNNTSEDFPNGVDDGLLPPPDPPVNRRPSEPRVPPGGGYLPVPSEPPHKPVGPKPVWVFLFFVKFNLMNYSILINISWLKI